MKKIFNNKIIRFLLIFFFISYAFKSFMFEEHKIPNHKMIGKELVFNKPLLYEKEGFQYRDIVDKIGIYLSTIYYPTYKKAIAYVPSDMRFKVLSVYFTNVKFNGQEIFYILEDTKGIKSIISEREIDFILSDVYEYCEGPNNLLDLLYQDNKSVTITLKAQSKRYLNKKLLHDCNLSDVDNKDNTHTMSINQNQLTCIYDHLWQRVDCDKYPVTYKFND